MRTVVVFSGGMDSTTLLFERLAAGDEVLALGINYGQRHQRELVAAATIAEAAGVQYEIADLSAIRRFLPGSSQTDETVAVPDGHYEDQMMRLTVVPNRNMILLAVATAWAVSVKADAVAYGAHSGDHAIYPDCRPEFVRAMQGAISRCDYRDIELLAPYQALLKADIACRGHKLGVPYGLTWSCYKGGDKHCGTCGTCVERREAFSLAGVPDPTEYA